jgi:hypothetical protein
MVSRNGATTLGCLFMMMILVGAGYYGKRVAKVYSNYYAYQDAMTQQAHFAWGVTDDSMKKRLAAKADSLSLPAEAADVSVLRNGRHISLMADYVEKVQLPGYVRSFHFTPTADHDY